MVIARTMERFPLEVPSLRGWRKNREGSLNSFVSAFEQTKRRWRKPGSLLTAAGWGGGGVADAASE